MCQCCATLFSSSFVFAELDVFSLNCIIMFVFSCPLSKNLILKRFVFSFLLFPDVWFPRFHTSFRLMNSVHRWILLFFRPFVVGCWHTIRFSHLWLVTWGNDWSQTIGDNDFNLTETLYFLSNFNYETWSHITRLPFAVWLSCVPFAPIPALLHSLPCVIVIVLSRPPFLRAPDSSVLFVGCTPARLPTRVPIVRRSLRVKSIWRITSGEGLFI